MLLIGLHWIVKFNQSWERKLVTLTLMINAIIFTIYNAIIINTLIKHKTLCIWCVKDGETDNVICMYFVSDNDTEKYLPVKN